MTSFANDNTASDISKIRVYDEELVDTYSSIHTSVLLDTWTVSISPDGSIRETYNRQPRIEDPVAVTFNYYYDGINNNNEPEYTVTMEAVGKTKIKKTKLQTKAEGVSTWASNTKTHNSSVATNSITYSYTSNPPSNPYVYAKADITIEDGTIYKIPQHKLTNAQ